MIKKFRSFFRSIPKKFVLTYLITVALFVFYISNYQYQNSLALLETTVNHTDWPIIIFLFLATLFVISNKSADFNKASRTRKSIDLYYYGGQLFIALFTGATFLIAFFVKISFLKLSLKSIKTYGSDEKLLCILAFLLITLIVLFMAIALNSFGDIYLDSWLFDSHTNQVHSDFKNVQLSKSKLSKIRSNAIHYW